MTRLPYRRSCVLTRSERSFFSALSQTVSGEMYVFPKGRLEDVIEVPEDAEGRMKYRGHVSSRHLDFVLCDKEQTSPLLAVELDDHYHQRSDRRERDEFVDRALETAGIPVLRYGVRRAYDVAELRAAIERKIRGAGAGSGTATGR